MFGYESAILSTKRKHIRMGARHPPGIKQFNGINLNVIFYKNDQKFINCINLSIFSHLPAGVTSIYLEIFDECTFTVDEKIAWAHIPIPQNVFEGQTVDDWYPISGRLGDGLEGTINLVLTYTVNFSLLQAKINQILETVKWGGGGGVNVRKF